MYKESHQLGWVGFEWRDWISAKNRQAEGKGMGKGECRQERGRGESKISAGAGFQGSVHPTELCLDAPEQSMKLDWKGKGNNEEAGKIVWSERCTE